MKHHKDISKDNRSLVIHLINSFTAGGSEMMMCRAAPYIQCENFRVIVCALSSQSDQAGMTMMEYLKNHGIEYMTLGKPVHRERLLTILNLFRLLHQYRPLILHTHCQSPDFYGFITGVLSDVPYQVSTLHGVESIYGLLQLRGWLDRLGLLHHITISQHVKEGMISAMHVEDSRIQVILNGIDLSAFENDINFSTVRRELFHTEAFPLIVSVGRLAIPKNFKKLLRAFALLVPEWSNAQLYIFGEGPLRPQLEDMIHSLGLSGRAHLPGVSNRIPEILRAADLFVLPSIREGFGLAAVEAMAAGLPVVASDVNGLQEVIISPEHGLLVPSQNPDQIFMAIDGLLRNPERMRTMGQAAKKRAFREFDIRQMAKKYTDFYNRVAGLGDRN